MYGQAREVFGDWMVEMFPPSPGIEPGTSKYESTQENIESFFGMIPQEKWELPLYALGGAGSLGKFSKKGLSKLHKTAKKVFGTTDDARESGFIIGDGSMLDFSRRSSAAPEALELKKYPYKARRFFDHTDIEKVGLEDVGGSKEFFEIGVENFVNKGGIRWTPEHLSFQIGKAPTQKQLSKMKKIHEDIPNWSSELSARSPALYNTQGKFTPKKPSIAIELSDDYSAAAYPLERWIRVPNVERIEGTFGSRDFKEFDMWTPWEEIERYILQYYKTGKGPSTTQQFRKY
jgi:hypothetical protein